MRLQALATHTALALIAAALNSIRAGADLLAGARRVGVAATVPDALVVNAGAGACGPEVQQLARGGDVLCGANLARAATDHTVSGGLALVVGTGGLEALIVRMVFVVTHINGHTSTTAQRAGWVHDAHLIVIAAEQV